MNSTRLKSNIVSEIDFYCVHISQFTMEKNHFHLILKLIFVGARKNYSIDHGQNNSHRIELVSPDLGLSL